jgi:hypothetical protein
LHWDGDPKEPRYRLIGILGDVLFSLDDHPQATMCFPLLEGGRTDFYAVLRTAGDPTALPPTVHREIGALDNDLSAFRTRTVEDLLGPIREPAPDPAFTAKCSSGPSTSLRRGWSP